MKYVRQAHERERAVGVEYYASDADGVGGRLRATPEDFRVRELERFGAEPVDADPDDYPHLLIRATLRGWDTNDLAGALSGAMGISRERVDWAGTKDKHAVTTQLFTVRGIDPERLPELTGADLEVVGRTGRNIHFGDLAGNAFEVVVRDPDRPEQVDAVTDDLRAFAGTGDAGEGDGDWRGDGQKEGEGEGDEEGDWDGNSSARVGVPNFFGQQRFGSRRPITHEVGLAVARGDWEGAVMAYLGNPDEAEPADTREAREYVERELRRSSSTRSSEQRPRHETRDWQGALDRFPGRLGHERAMLHRLAEDSTETASAAEDSTEAAEVAEDGTDDPGDFRAALENVPTNLQRLFVHAGQSYAFNRVLSERMARGLPFHRPVEGDVVCFADREARRASGRASGRSPRERSEREHETAESDRGSRAALGGLELPDVDRTQRVTADRVETITRHCERGRAFVTAPLVGTDTELADGEPGEIERAVLDDLGLDPGDFDLPGEFDSPGTRRAILVRTELAVERDPLTFAFRLPKGSYATVILREYLKGDPLVMG